MRPAGRGLDSTALQHRCKRNVDPKNKKNRIAIDLILNVCMCVKRFGNFYAHKSGHLGANGNPPSTYTSIHLYRILNALGMRAKSSFYNKIKTIKSFYKILLTN